MYEHHPFYSYISKDPLPHYKVSYCHDVTIAMEVWTRRLRSFSNANVIIYKLQSELAFKKPPMPGSKELSTLMCNLSQTDSTED